MASSDTTGLPRCAIDFPLDIAPGEIGSLSHAVNTLLKSSYLLGTSIEIDPTILPLFDISEEIADAESAGFLIRPDDHPGPWEIRCSRHVESSPSPEQLTLLLAPGSMVVQFQKPVLLDSEKEPAFQPICDSWSSRSLVAFPLRKDREVVGSLDALDLIADGQPVLGYLLFDSFTATSAEQIIPFYADWSYHTAGVDQRGSIVMPDGSYVATFMLSEDNSPWGSPLLRRDIEFEVGAAPIPEPGTMMLLGSGLIGLAGWGRRKLRK